jgi:hypothetical protein
MAKQKLIQPPAVKQGVGYKCWAAALESWLAVTPSRMSWTQEQLLKRRDAYVQPFDPTLPQEGSINADVFKLMNRDAGLHLNMLYEEKPKGADIPDDYFYTLLFANGYLFVVYTAEATSGVRHANVIWGAGTDGYVNVMDPMRGTYINKVSDELRTPFLVAWANKEYVDPWAAYP